MAVPFVVLTSTERPPSTALSKVKVTVAVPSASATVTSAIVTVAWSSLVMVPTPVASSITTLAPAGFVRPTVNVSSSSTTASSETVTVMVLLDSPSTKLTVPEVAV